MVHLHRMMSLVGKQVPGAEWLVGGFPCTDVSQLNKSAYTSGTRNTIRDRSLRTGAVFGNIIDYLSSTLVPFCILENVAALAKVGLDGTCPLRDCIDMLVEIGYIVQAFQLDAMYFGFPIHRLRLYFICIHKSVVGGRTATEVQTLLKNTFDRFVYIIGFRFIQSHHR